MSIEEISKVGADDRTRRFICDSWDNAYAEAPQLGDRYPNKGNLKVASIKKLPLPGARCLVVVKYIEAPVLDEDNCMDDLWQGLCIR